MASILGVRSYPDIRQSVGDELQHKNCPLSHDPSRAHPPRAVRGERERKLKRQEADKKVRDTILQTDLRPLVKEDMRQTAVSICRYLHANSLGYAKFWEDTFVKVDKLRERYCSLAWSDKWKDLITSESLGPNKRVWQAAYLVGALILTNAVLATLQN